jgi:hypothetical protein
VGARGQGQAEGGGDAPKRSATAPTAPPSRVQVFDVLLLDADWAINNGNWLWLSASAYFHQFFRVYSPVAFPKVRAHG